MNLERIPESQFRKVMIVSPDRMVLELTAQTAAVVRFIRGYARVGLALTRICKEIPISQRRA